MRIIIKTFLTALLCCVLSVNTYASTTGEVKQNIVQQAKAMGVEPAIVLSIAKTESGFNQEARSLSGHIGVFQLSHHTAKHMGLNPHNLNDNIKGGILYYKKMYETFGSMELAVAAYNSGPEAIKRCNYTVPKHTQQFVTKIMDDYRNYQKLGI